MPKNLHETANQWLMKLAEGFCIASNVTEIGRKVWLSIVKTAFTFTTALRANVRENVAHLVGLSRRMFSLVRSSVDSSCPPAKKTN